MLFLNYLCRKVLRRFTNNALTVGATALVLAGCMVGVAFLRGLDEAIQRAAPPEHIIVTGAGATAELESALKPEVVQQLAVMPRVRSENGKAQVSPELVGVVVLSTPETIGKTEEGITLRGVDPIALEIHRVKVIEGRGSAPDQRELMIGAQLQKKHPGLGIGSTIELPGGAWQVVGIFTADGAVFESEAWGHLAGLMRDFRQESVSTAVIVAESAADVPRLIEEINASKRLSSALARPEREFREGAAGLASVQSLVLILVIMLCAAGLFATVTNIDASLITRIPEFATMIALGVRRNRVALLAMQESVLLALVAAVIATGLASLLNGRSTAIIHASALFDLSIGLEVVLVGFGLALVVGVAGGLLPALSLRRVDLVQGLR